MSMLIEYFLNDFQKSLIKHRFSKYDIYFEDGHDRTYVLLKDEKLAPDYKIASSAEWVCNDPKPSSQADFRFVKTHPSLFEIKPITNCTLVKRERMFQYFS